MIARYRPYAAAWEAVYTAGFTLEQLRRRALALAEGLAARGQSCLVAYDTRFMGGLFARDLGAAIQARGVRTILSAAPSPLPALCHALDQHVADCALYVSACNRPYVYNGLVLIAPQGAGLALDPLDGAEAPLLAAPFPPTGELPPDQTRDLRGPYLDALRNAVDLDLVRRTSMTIFIDAMSGTTAGLFPALLGEGGQTRAIEINREPDPLFGRAAPAPTEAGLNRLKKLVRESDSHLGLAISADGTALAVIDKNGEQLDPAETALLVAAYLARQHRQRGAVVLAPPAPASPLGGVLRLAAWEEATGLKVEGMADPGARLAELVGRDRGLPVLGATADGELIVGRYAAYPDAVLAGLICAEMVARSGGNLRALIDAQREQLLKG
ncbi:MAG TPA: phosphoglucomutase [Chloroflexaceae bacterium]|nr:phosphoglucomutase [Chloroflexaceae bacterium]